LSVSYVGSILLPAGFVLAVTIALVSQLAGRYPIYLLVSIGLGFILPSLNLGSLRLLDKNLISQGSSIINFVRMLGGAIGVSLCSLVLEWRLVSHGDSLTLSASSPARLTALNESFLMLATLCVLALVAALQLR
jgi:hypothetical protein